MPHNRVAVRREHRMLRLNLLVFLGLASGLMGCTAMNGSGRGFLASLRPKSETRAAENARDPWVDETGAMTKQIHSPEMVKDPLKLRDIFMSDTAREIEQNLGVAP